MSLLLLEALLLAVALIMAVVAGQRVMRMVGVRLFNGEVTRMDTQGRAESQGRIERQGSGIVQNEVWQEGKLESTSEGCAKDTRASTAEGVFSCKDGVSKGATEGREGQTYETEAITYRMGSLW
tara:strand:- start:912 stop:1283 length:372 start_codon:yes stop_codon:yes gene_type:complete